ncbi:uroporphyrinogen-III synthase [Neolewinella agarilytica]|uniref:uroporphyrinogen-III synthase n=1 Tax=Neolewinella agarilytica TaxID=478744 RepID=UPI0023553CB4|nr:uroporphyrinogen-III synthase [Neolewinella agarilytica]
MAIQVRILPPSALFISDPQGTDLGKRILANSISLINKVGLEDFTFRKLAENIGSAEASVYRYFSNKNQLLLYLTNWYWDWVHHLVVQEMVKERDPWLRLKAAIGVLVRPYSSKMGADYINQAELHQLIVNEGTKAYRTKLVDQKNSKGLFWGYKGLTEEISKMILRIDPQFRHPKALASSIFEMAHDHPFFARHIPRLTDLENNEDISDRLEEMLWIWTTKLLGRSPQKALGTATSPCRVFVTRNLKADSALRHWADVSGNIITGRSLLKFAQVPFEVPAGADWWFFYSSKAAEFSLFSVTLPDNVRLAAIGEGTAKTLRELTGRVDFVGKGSPVRVAEQFKAIAEGDRVFFPRAKKSLLTIQRLLDEHVTVLDAVCYDNEPIVVTEPIEADVFIFTSPMNVGAYLDQQELAASTRVLAIGGRTAAALYQRGYSADFPKTPSEQGLVEILAEGSA